MMPTTNKPFTDKQWLAFWEHYKGLEHQQDAVLKLGRHIRQADHGLLHDSAEWAADYRSGAAAPAGLDPRGSEEAGMVGPKIKAPVKPGDSYLLVNDRDEDMEAYDHTGNLLWKVPCLARGQGRDNEWRKRNTDTPPGLYRLGKVYADYGQNPTPLHSDTAQAYGWYSFDMEELEGQESRNNRAGIMLHGGGTACGWPGAWYPSQKLYPTLGCIRLRNIDLRDKVLPLYRQGIVFVGVFQEP
jgi:hypothetical protein